MGLVELDLDLGEEERAVLDSVRKFASEVMRPIGAQLDRMTDPTDVIAPASPLWEAYGLYRDLGIDEVRDPSGPLDPVRRARLGAMISEELGWGDAGLAISFGVAGFPRMMAAVTGNPALIERFGSAEVVGCWAITEPDHGSDMIDFENKLRSGASAKPNCIARKDGDSFVITGQKAAWVSNGTIATAAALFCAVDTGDGKTGSGVFLAPLDEKGVSRGRPLDKIGQRALNQGEIFFDGLRVPASHMVLGPELYAVAADRVLCMANGGMGSCFVGLARAALEHAIAYAKERVQGGVPIIRHQSVKARLFEMFRKVEAARSLNRRVVVHNTVSPNPQIQYAIASKVTSTNTAFEVASGAVQIYGGNGLAREYPVEKLLRDARASMIEDGCNDLLSLVGAERL
ncbi:MAG: acyl-CoA/acyl-ACP dehydrogenase [Deltaproteobacteria bacterium]|nr:acyl-CoA/acyl-ACP dehydrogenase [Deltaproteobacteria bacterium]